MDQLIDQVLHDRYQVRSLLGRKTGRRTFLATDWQTDSIVVLKLLLFAPDFTWDDLKLFEREAETLKSLDHAAIPQYFDYFEINTELGKGFALVQSYIEAQSLQQWIQSGRTFSEAELKAIAGQLLEILAYLHDRQPPIIHRDIKPSNILLGDRSGNSPGQVYLIDFGSVQTVAHDGTVTVVGTYGYMPPEQFGGRSLPASDLFSLGATLIYLATGQHPADLPQDDLRIEFEKFASLSKPFSQWIRNLTEPSLTKRAASVREAIDCLQQPPRLQTDRRFSLMRRPASKIQLESTSTRLQLKVPRSQTQFDYSPWTGCLILVFIFACFFIIGQSVSIAPALTWTIFSLGVLWIVFWIAMKLSSSTSQNLSEAYSIRFELKHGSVFVSLALDAATNVFLISPQKLRSISVESYKMTRYRLNFECKYADGKQHKFHIIGGRAEIQWLCDELIEWGNLKIEYLEASA